MILRSKLNFIQMPVNFWLFIYFDSGNMENGEEKLNFIKWNLVAAKPEWKGFSTLEVELLRLY